jgi:hypothetical protein
MISVKIVPKPKMADQLPKWQILPANCQNGSQQQILCQTLKNLICQYGKIIFLFFFLAIADKIYIIREKKGWIEK